MCWTLPEHLLELSFRHWKGKQTADFDISDTINLIIKLSDYEISKGFLRFNDRPVLTSEPNGKITPLNAEVLKSSEFGQGVRQRSCQTTPSGGEPRKSTHNIIFQNNQDSPSFTVGNISKACTKNEMFHSQPESCLFFLMVLWGTYLYRSGTS